MTTLLIGGTGFLGSAVARRLADRDLALMIRAGARASSLAGSQRVRVGDLGDPLCWPRVFEGVDALIYCASMGFGHVPPLVDFLGHTEVRRAVFISTTALFTTLPTASRAPRLAAEQAVQESDLAWTILRPTMIYGSIRDRNISRLLRWLHRCPVFPLFGNGAALQQPVYVDDLADGVIAALDTPASVKRTYNLGGGAPIAYAELIRCAAAALGRRVWLAPVPSTLALALVRALNRLLPTFPIQPEQIRRLAENKAFDNAPAIHDFGFQSRSFAEGVKLEALSLGLAPLTVDSHRLSRVPRPG